MNLRDLAWPCAAASVILAVGLCAAPGAGLLLAIGGGGPVAPAGSEVAVPPGRAEDLLAAMPAPPIQALRSPRGDPPVVRLASGVAVSLAPPASVLLTGRIALASGPSDHGLENLACLAGGRMHESLVGLDCGDAGLLKTACLASFGLRDGEPAGEGDELPPRGVPLRVELRWADDDGRHRLIDASCLVRDRRTDRGLPPLPYVWTGSRMGTVGEPDGRGGVRETPVFLLALGRVLAANENAADALLASPLPPSSDLLRWEVNTALAPLLEHPVALVISRAELPLELRLLPDGDLALPGGTLLDAGALTMRIATAFQPHRPGRLHAIRVRVAPEVARDRDAAARQTLMRAAARAGVWCLPVFEPDGADPGPDLLLSQAERP